MLILEKLRTCAAVESGKHGWGTKAEYKAKRGHSPSITQLNAPLLDHRIKWNQGGLKTKIFSVWRAYMWRCTHQNGFMQPRRMQVQQKRLTCGGKAPYLFSKKP